LCPAANDAHDAAYPLRACFETKFAIAITVIVCNAPTRFKHHSVLVQRFDQLDPLGFPRQ
jgi:hypothetical protein